MHLRHNKKNEVMEYETYYSIPVVITSHAKELPLLRMMKWMMIVIVKTG